MPQRSPGQAAQTSTALAARRAFPRSAAAGPPPSAPAWPEPNGAGQGRHSRAFSSNGRRPPPEGARLRQAVGGARALEAERRRGKAPQKLYGLLALQGVRRAGGHASLRCSLPVRGRGRAAAMKRPCEETSSDSDMDETIDVGSENNYSG